MFDKEHLSNQLEVMKMAQASLQQIMVLSSGGLVLFFGFIGDASFIASADKLAAAVIASWVLALSTAAYSHSSHSTLFTILARFSSSIRRLDDLERIPAQLEEELAINPNPNGVRDRLKREFAEERENLSSSIREFEKEYFPAQTKTLIAMRLSLTMLILGFLLLGIAYVFAD